MKKLISLAFVIILALAFCIGLASCNNLKFEIKFTVDGEVYNTVKTGGSEVVAIPPNPTKDGYTFGGWYWDEGTWNKPFTTNSLLNAPISSDMKVYAKWNCIHTPAAPVTEGYVDSTCDEFGGYYTVVYCTTCNEQISSEKKIIEKKAHTPKAAVIENFVDSTCKTAGGYSSVVYCSECNEKISTAYNTVAKKPHNEVSHNAKEPTCTEIGWDAYVSCTECDYTTYQAKSALKHNLTNYGAKAPTCTENGWDAYATCSRCVYTTYNERPALGHDRITHNAKAPTCTEIGWDAYVSCSRCVYTTYVEKPPLDHDLEYYEAKEPTCTSYGWEAYAACSRCVYSTYKQSQKLDHSFSTELLFNTTHHYYACECGTKRSEAKHISSGPPTATNDEICTACGYVIANAIGIKFNTLTTNGAEVYGKVSTNTDYFSFADEITVVGNAGYFVSTDSAGNNQIFSKDIDLLIGDNTVYVTEYKNNKITTVYTVTIRRRTMYTLTFNAKGGSEVETMEVEEDTVLTAPVTERPGYTFTGWDYDFTQPITADANITATWSRNQKTPYKVEYYLQNLEGDGYDLVETAIGYGPTDTDQAGAFQREYEHFTFYPDISTIGGIIKGDGSLVLKVYFTRDKYTVSNSTPEYGSISPSGEFVYGTQLELSVLKESPGYEFKGWYSNNKLISAEPTVTISEITGDIEAIFVVSSKLANFSFTSTDGTCIITGIKDKTVTQIVIPDFVTGISKGALAGCVNLESITVPFVGGSKSATSASSSTLFGYIFGDLNYDGSTATEQEYSGGKFKTYYVPTSLKSVTVTGGNIFYGSFYNCVNLTSITLPDSATAIGNYAFNYCTSLANVTMGKNTTSIGEKAFNNCTALQGIEIVNGVETIGQYAFYGCTLLKTIVIPDSVTEINNSVFQNCTSLTKATIGDGVIRIRYDAFRGCTSLAEVVIGLGVKNIYGYAFYNCTALKSIKYRGTLEQWLNEINRGEGWNKYDNNGTDTVISYVVYYNCTD